MKAVFLCGGAREKCFSALVRENIVQLEALIVPIGNDRVSHVLEIADLNNIPIIELKRDKLADTLKSLQVELLVSAGYPYLINKEALGLVEYAINVHPTLLPRYRGYRSGPYIIINGEEETGVTIHFIDEGMDTGDILLQYEVKLTPFDTTRSMMRKTSHIEGEVLCEAIKLLKAGTLKVIKQDEDEATIYNYKRTPKDSLVDSNKPLKELYNTIRASDPKDYPAFFYVDGEKVCIKMWRPEKPIDEEDMV